MEGDPRGPGEVPAERRPEENPPGAEPRGRDDDESRPDPGDEDLRQDRPGTDEEAVERGDE